MSKEIIDFAYLTMCAEHDYIYETGEAKALLNYITNLQQENQQLKDIIKEIKAYVMANCLYNFKYDEDELFEIITDEKASDDLMEILDKVKE